jgi:hypothetical protein
MEEQNQVLWDFLDTAFKAGTIDEFLLLSKSMADKKYEDQAQVFSDLEDAIDEMDDLSDIDEKMEMVFGFMPDLTDQETMEGVTILLSLINPIIKNFMEAADRDMETIKEMRDAFMKDFKKVKKALFAISSAGAKALVSSQGTESANKYGRQLGQTINSMSSIVNEMHDKDPKAVSEFMSGVFSAVDKDEMQKMTDVMLNSFLDQKPPLFSWTTSSMIKRAKKRFWNK